jgi:LmbE family N-acetylglucosaminyl deacetylase
VKILAFFAHPDDETMLIGGTLALLAQSGAEVHYVCATRGEGGELGEPALSTRQELGAVREAELVCAVRLLGGASLAFLDYVDPLVGPEDTLFAFSDDPAVLAAQVAGLLKEIQPTAVFTHGSDGEYGHPAHVICHQAARAAVAACSPEPPLLYTVQGTFPDHPRPRLSNPSDPAHLIIDVTPVISRKEAAALCHRTQHALFVRRLSEELGHPVSVPEALLRVESLHRALPPVPQGSLPDDPVARLLLQAGVVLNTPPQFRAPAA